MAAHPQTAGASVRRWICAAAALAAFAIFGPAGACGGEGGGADDGGAEEDVRTDDTATDDGVIDEGSASDDGAADDGVADDGSATDDGGDDACDPGCHWDCFGGIGCEEGEVWLYGNAPRDCCHYRDPWPGPGPVCGFVMLADCAPEACDPDAAGDPRYTSCLEFIDDPVLENWEHIPPTLCAGGWGRRAGDPCATDDDCRPAAEDAAPRLRCDVASSTCVADVRPAAPAGFGASCGLTPADLEESHHDGREILAAGATCDVCYAAWNEPGNCWRQACTIPCRFDEDCPDGTVCLCPLTAYNAVPGQFCAAATDRESSAGRSAGLVCP